MIATRAYAQAQRTLEVLFTPASDAGFRVGRDIRRVKNAEGRRQGKPAGEWFTAVLRIGMAAGTAGSAIEIFALLDLRID